MFVYWIRKFLYIHDLNGTLDYWSKIESPNIWGKNTHFTNLPQFNDRIWPNGISSNRILDFFPTNMYSCKIWKFECLVFLISKRNLKFAEVRAHYGTVFINFKTINIEQKKFLNKLQIELIENFCMFVSGWDITHPRKNWVHKKVLKWILDASAVVSTPVNIVHI